MCGGDIGKAIGSVGNTAKAIVNNPSKGIQDLMHSDAGTAMRGGQNILNNSVLDPITGYSSDSAPTAPGIDPNLQRLKDSQMANAKNFRSNLPALQNQTNLNLRSDQNRNLSGQLGAAKESQSRRGLLYGGMAQGQNAQLRGNAASNLAGAISQSNTGLNAAADQLDAQALDTAYGIQKNQQAIQDSIYSQAQARLNGQNSMIGNIASTAALVAMV